MQKRVTEKMIDERHQLSLQKFRNQNDLYARLEREKNRHIGELVNTKGYFDRQNQRLERKLVQSKRQIVK